MDGEADDLDVGLTSAVPFQPFATVRGRPPSRQAHWRQ